MEKNEHDRLPNASVEFSPKLSPELASLEASLAEVRPISGDTAREKTKALALLEICRQAMPDTPNLIETILESGEQRITVSLRRYVRMERFRAGAIGVVLGLIFGAILNVFGLMSLYMLLKIL